MKRIFVLLLLCYYYSTIEVKNILLRNKTVCKYKFQSLDVSSEEIRTYKDINLGCQEESGVSKEALQNAEKGKFPEDNKSLKKYAVCVLKNYGFLYDDGIFNVEEIRAHMESSFSKSQTNKFIEKCVKNKATAEEAAWEYFKCRYYYNNL